MRKFTPLEQAALVREYILRYREMRKFPYEPPGKIAEYQLSTLRGIVKLAYEGTRFYRDLYSSAGIHPNDIRSWQDFSRLPTVTKQDVIDNKGDCIVEVRRSEKNLRTSRSSGSSGQMLEIVAGTDRWVRSALLMLRMYQGALGFGPFDRGALIYTSQYPFHSAWGLYRVEYLHTLTPAYELVDSLVKLKPTFIISYPSILMDLAFKYPEQCRSLNVRAIATNSEHSSQDQRDWLSRAFGAPVFDEYSSEELILGGFQCAKGRYHLQEDCAYLEILDVDTERWVDAGRVGEIVGTSLVHGVMPFIRYRQGDLGAIRESDCSCGNNGRILSDIAGRKNAGFKFSDGRKIPSGKVLDWTYRLVLDYDLPIAQFQIIQDALHHIQVKIVPTPGLYVVREHELVISRTFKEYFGEVVKVDVEKVDNIPRTPAGKHMPIISLLP